MASPAGGPPAGSVLRRSARLCRPAMVAVAVFSLATNLLQFVVPLYMLQIYDRVITSRSGSTLAALSGIAAFLLVVAAVLEALRSRILVRVGAAFNNTVADAVFAAVHARRLCPAQPGESRAAQAQALRDVDTVRDFASGAGLLALCDTPWFPLFILAAFVLHPLYGWVALAGATAIVALMLLNELATRRVLALAGTAGFAANQSVQSSLGNAGTLQAMGMLGAMRGRWREHHDRQLAFQGRASDRAGAIVAATRGCRALLQVGILGTGAWLAIRGEVSPGSIVAASILVGRALQPVEVLAAQWRNVVAARAALGRLKTLLALAPPRPAGIALPPPTGQVACEDLRVVLGPGGRPVLDGVGFVLPAGSSLAVLGPSAAGKSTLLRALAGVQPVERGSVRLDGHDIAGWDPAVLGGAIGLLPQGVDLFAGTVAQNIARFGAPDPAGVIAAAQAAGCHAAVQRLPQGYDTPIDEAGAGLSGGQKQQIGLARALYGAPRLVLLDEPNSHLDGPGQQALVETLAGLRARGATTVVATHNTAVLAVVDYILLLRNGTAQGFGPCKELLAHQHGLAKPGKVG